jgi:hypothetical protein
VFTWKDDDFSSAYICITSLHKVNLNIEHVVFLQIITNECIIWHSIVQTQIWTNLIYKVLHQHDQLHGIDKWTFLTNYNVERLQCLRIGREAMIGEPYLIRQCSPESHEKDEDKSMAVASLGGVLLIPFAFSLSCSPAACSWTSSCFLRCSSPTHALDCNNPSSRTKKGNWRRGRTMGWIGQDRQET